MDIVLILGARSTTITAAHWHDGQISSLFALSEFHSNHAGPATNEKRGTQSAAFEFSAFVLLHKPREAMAEEMKGRVVGGEGKTAEVDGGYLVRMRSPPMSKHIAVIAVSPGTKAASVRLS
jgi:hypothetical protein